MAELRVEFSDQELRALEAAARDAGVPTEEYVRDASLRERTRRTFLATAVAFYDENVAEFDQAFPEEAPGTRAA
ncbi:hypothetical protein [Streptomyces sp. Inha503]|uniref:hypothetical protein n=1 Tax=Streptomyces sp. Inha503 TaxID=3383314 RepID=UPI0039A136E2